VATEGQPTGGLRAGLRALAGTLINRGPGAAAEIGPRDRPMESAGLLAMPPSRPREMTKYRRAPMRLKRPHVATLDEVAITREDDGAVIAYKDRTGRARNDAPPGRGCSDKPRTVAGCGGCVDGLGCSPTI